MIRKANKEDVYRIAEIEVFNYRLYFYPIFQNDDYYFDELQVSNQIDHYNLDEIYVYDDGVVKGFIQINNSEVKKLFVEPVLHNQKIGSKLLEYGIDTFNVNHLWALEKNNKAISFYKRYGFELTNEKKLVDDTTEHLVHLKK